MKASKITVICVLMMGSNTLWTIKRRVPRRCFEQKLLGHNFHVPSHKLISKEAFNFIVDREVTNKTFYERFCRHPILPKERSGVTIGVGYDLGYATKRSLNEDWGGILPPRMVKALERAVGLKGRRAARITAKLRNQVDIPWQAAIAVLRHKVIPRWLGLINSQLPNTCALGPDSLGALLSVTYNRGASFDKPGNRYAEMRAIKTFMARRAFHKIPDVIRSMKRLWPHMPGLQERREREAQLFEQGFASEPTAFPDQSAVAQLIG